MRWCTSFVALVGFVLAGVAHAATLDFPDLGLTSAPDEVRAWARENEFTPAQPGASGEEAYQRAFPDGQRESIGFIPGDGGLDMLRFDQAGVLELAPTLRRKAYRQFGKPDKDQILEGGTLRLIYPYDSREPARRVFLFQPHHVSMFLMTEAYVDRVDHAQAEADRKEEEAVQSEKREATRAWLFPLLWVAGIGLALAAFAKVAPQPISAPVKTLLRGTFGLLFEIVYEVGLWLYHGGRVALMWGSFFFSSMAVGVGALEWGTSWWWGLPWLGGTVMMFKADEEDELRTELVAVGLFAISLFGVFLQGGFSGS